MFDIGLMHYLFVSILLVAAGVGCMLTKRNALGILIGVELVLNAASLNLVAFNRFAHQEKTLAGVAEPVTAIDGNMFAIFIIVLAAAEAALTE